jgi:hypothetical protein
MKQRRDEEGEINGAGRGRPHIVHSVRPQTEEIIQCDTESARETTRNDIVIKE